MSLVKKLFERDIGLRKSPKLDSIDFALSKVSLNRRYLFNDLNDVGAPPLALALKNRLLSVANDGGDVALIDKNDLTERHKWTAHNNAIFDVKWRTGSDHHLATASGDKSVIIWDINKVQKSYSYDFAHNGSIKSIDFKDENVFASGSRDGLIKIWDLRCGRGGSVLVIESAHLSKLPSIKSSPKVRPQKTSPLNSVTCVVFNPLTDLLYSSGANDGTIKLWDLRKCRKNKINKTSSTPIKELYQTSRRGSPSHGFTCLTFDKNYRLFASCSDHNIYGYSGDSSLPSMTCMGLKVNNFTRINTFGANYLVSGSVNGSAYIWNICSNSSNGLDSTKIFPIYSLPHSEEEVTAIVTDSDSYSLYTCCDDQSVNKWSLFNPNLELEKSTKSEAFVPNADQIKTIEDKPKANLLTPPLNTSHPFSSLTNWLETSGKRITPSYPNPKRMRLTQSSPTHRPVMKENSLRHKTSKRKLFNNNRKINEYFTP